MSDSPTLRRSQRVRANLGLPPVDARMEDTPRRRRNSSTREPEDRTVVAVSETNSRRMQPVSEDSEDNDSPFNDTFVRNEASRINTRAGSTSRRDPNHFDPGEVSDRASHYDSAEDLPQGLRSDYPEEETPDGRAPPPGIGRAETRSVVNVGDPGPSAATGDVSAEPATQRGAEMTALQTHLLDRMHSHNMEHHQRLNDLQERFEQRLAEETSRLRETAQREHALELGTFREEAEDARRENQEMRRCMEDLMVSVDRLSRETREQNSRSQQRSSRHARSSPRRSRREDRHRNDPERVQARAARSERRRRDEEREETRRHEEWEQEREVARERERDAQRQRELDEAREQERMADRRRQQRREAELQQERDRLGQLEEERARQREQRERERVQAREAERRMEANQGFMPEDTENFPPRSASPANSRRPSQRGANLNQSLDDVTSQAGSRSGSQRGSRREPRPHLPSANVPTYSGASACDDWLETVENMARAYHWNEEVLKSALTGAFSAKVKNYLRSCGLTELSSFPDIKRQLLIRYGAHRNIDGIQKKFQHLSQYDGEKAEEYFDRVISERMHGWKDEPVEERDRQAIARFIYTVKHKPLSDYLELKRRDFELLGQRLDQSKFRELMFTYLSQQEIYSYERKCTELRTDPTYRQSQFYSQVGLPRQEESLIRYGPAIVYNNAGAPANVNTGGMNQPNRNDFRPLTYRPGGYYNNTSGRERPPMNQYQSGFQNRTIGPNPGVNVENTTQNSSLPKPLQPNPVANTNGSAGGNATAAAAGAKDYSNMICFGCKEKGHIVSNCPKLLAKSSVNLVAELMQASVEDTSPLEAQVPLWKENLMNILHFCEGADPDRAVYAQSAEGHTLAYIREEIESIPLDEEPSETYVNYVGRRVAEIQGN